jgi:hypothetical protein
MNDDRLYYVIYDGYYCDKCERQQKVIPKLTMRQAQIAKMEARGKAIILKMMDGNLDDTNNSQ